MDSEKIIFSIVILTYNREKYLKLQLPELNKLKNSEVIIVDNCSDDNYSERLSRDYANTQVVRLDKNYGAVGRNYGIEKAQGKYIVTLDDDVWGITNNDLATLENIFLRDDSIQGICFKVIDENTNEISNWCHNCDPLKFSSKHFDTYKISEGAVAFNRKIFDEVGLYPIEFFISHEGPDLAYRILKAGSRVLYCPEVTVTHAHAVEGRTSWRRYYYDTRNLIWLAYRHYNLQMLIFWFPLQILSMFTYSVRDGFAKYYFKGVKDAIRGLKQFRDTRNPIDSMTMKYIKEIDRNKPSILYYIKKRLLKKGVKI